MGKETAGETLEKAINTYIEGAGVPLTEFDAGFALKMVQAMMVSHFKYGRVADAYPARYVASSDIRTRMGRYRETGNKHYLVDVANFAMIEAMHPNPSLKAEWKENSASDSPGRVSQSGKRLVQEDNKGERIIGETILHYPEETK